MAVLRQTAGGPAAREAAAQLRGMRTIAVLAVLTIAEYAAAVGLHSALMLLVVLTPIAVVKAWIIVMSFMHLARVWRGEGTEEGEGAHG